MARQVPLVDANGRTLWQKDIENATSLQDLSFPLTFKHSAGTGGAKTTIHKLGRCAISHYSAVTSGYCMPAVPIYSSNESLSAPCAVDANACQCGNFTCMTHACAADIEETAQSVIACAPAASAKQQRCQWASS